MKIGIEFNMDSALYELVVQSHNFASMPAGPRLLKAEPHPEVQWRHASLKEAERDAEKLQRYIDTLGAKKVSRAKERREGA